MSNTTSKTKYAHSNHIRLKPFLDAVPSGYKEFVSPGYEPLVLERLEGEDFKGYPAYSLMHYYKQNGDVMRDPEMTFFVVHDHQWIIPMMYQLDAFGIYQTVFPNETEYRPRLLKELDDFLNTWTQNILSQGFTPTQYTH